MNHPRILTIAVVLAIAPTAAMAQPTPTEPTPEDLGWDESDSESPAEPTAAPTPPLPPPRATPPVDPAADEERQWRLRQHNRYRSMMISGWTMLGAAYGASVLVGAIAVDLGRDQDDDEKVRYGWRMFIPFGGPIAAATVSRSVTWGIVTAGASAAQVVGLSLGIAGTVRLRQHPDPNARRFAITAMPTRGGAHAAIRWRF
jgi:hypothetical protein